MREAAERKWQRWALTLVKCVDVNEWVSALLTFPEAVPGGYAGDLAPEELKDALEKACGRRDVMPVCEDGIERGFIESTGTQLAIVGVGVAGAICELSEAVADEGVSITLSTKYKHSMSDVDCVLRETGAPQYVTEHIDHTRALDGQQEDEWADYRARWTYHPDDGLNITFIWHA